MQKKITLIIICILLLPLIANAGESAAENTTYSLEQCISIALEKHQSLRASAGAIKANESKVGQAKANYYPQLNLSTSYDRIGPYAPAGTTPDSYDKYSAGINLGVTLFDFGKTSTNVDIQDLNVTASRADYDDVKAQIILNVKKAYYKLLQAQRNKDVAVDTMKQFQQHLDQANAFFRIGTKPKFDVTKAEVDFSNAKLSVLKADNAVRAAMITLKDAMGVPENADFTIIDNLAFQKNELELNDILKKAFADRPDLMSIMTKREAAERAVDLARKDYYPILSGSAGYGFSGTDFPLGRGWNAGAALSFPLFSGFSTKYHVDEANASLDVIKANENAIRQAIRLEVEQAYLDVQNTAEQIAVTEMTVAQAQENYDLASGRYRTGVGNPIEVADATITLNNARANLNTALYNYKIAQAALEKSIGAKP
ncbi:MAG: TolC family protein [Syntrophaceae bacterium]|nr:TolC family protein [Syntrophaceae bacterium]